MGEIDLQNHPAETRKAEGSVWEHACQIYRLTLARGEHAS